MRIWGLKAITVTETVLFSERCPKCGARANVAVPYVSWLCPRCGEQITPLKQTHPPQRSKPDITTFFHNGGKSSAEKESSPKPLSSPLSFDRPTTQLTKAVTKVEKDRFADLATIRRLRRQKIRKRKFYEEVLR